MEQHPGSDKRYGSDDQDEQNKQRQSWESSTGQNAGSSRDEKLNGLNPWKNW